MNPDGLGMEKGMSQEEVDAEIQSLFEALTEYVAASSGEETNGGISVTQGDGKVFISFNQANLAIASAIFSLAPLRQYSAAARMAF